MKKSFLIGIGISIIGIIIFFGAYLALGKKDIKIPENPTTQIRKTSKILKEFQFYEITPRMLFWWFWDNNGPIGEVTSFYMNSWTSLPDFEIMKNWIADIFLNKKAYIQRSWDAEIKICTQTTWWLCFVENGTLVENFIKKYWL